LPKSSRRSLRWEAAFDARPGQTSATKTRESLEEVGEVPFLGRHRVENDVRRSQRVRSGHPWARAQAHRHAALEAEPRGPSD
jgi:hypothetical protein